MKLNALLSTSYLVGTVVSQAPPTVRLKDAIYEGTTTKIATSATSTVTVDKFLGVRFAAKPTRFRAARLPSPGNATVKATKQPPACGDDEDCLFLNIFAPHIKKKTSAPKPVMIWWHGGALQSGSASGTDGSILAANEDVIVIASQYRLGVFGFPGNISGIPGDELNAGFRDQKLALQWIQENIASFGGDKNKVTIFGDSAGAVSVDSQLLSQPFEKPLFHGAILQSGGLHTFNRIALTVGPPVTGLGTGNLPTEAPFITLARTLNCPTDTSSNEVLTCVQSKTFTEVKAGVSKANLLFPPVDDNGLSSVGDSDSARRAGRTTKVPILLGSTFEEGNIFPTAGIASKTLEEWAEFIYPGSNQTTQRDAVINAYAIGSSWQIGSASDARNLLHSDYHFACTTRYDSNIISGLGTNPIWRYVFNASMPNGRLAGHGSDVGFVFGTSVTQGQSTATPANQELSRKMQRAWADFARNPAAGPGWIQYGSVKESLANLGGEGERDGITLVDPVVVDSRCHVFDDVYDPNRPR